MVIFYLFFEDVHKYSLEFGNEGAFEGEDLNTFNKIER
jgi:hypothetical protein